MRSAFRFFAGLTFAALATASPSLPAAPAVSFSPNDISSLFSISKSENKNEVLYAMRLDENCAPVGTTPVFGYWRMNEKGPGQTEPLLSREQSAYGIASQTVRERNTDGGKVRFTLKAVPDRPIDVVTRRDGSTCRAWSTMAIQNQKAFLYNVFAKVRWPFGVSYLLLSGWSEDRTRVLQERIEP
ncbi:MAG: DUF4833 domain-containing protein [Candidatus Hydrogenedentes bacterium]|nr:DUF4833 domain-containing protein [Candidatus Hydrogenedentota bacterium]